MTVAVVVPKNIYTGTGGTNSYPFTFSVYSSAQINVTVTSPANVVTTLFLGLDYSVTGLNPSGDPPSTGTIVLINNAQAWLTGANLTTGWTITIQSNFALAQSTSFRNGGDFYRSALENGLDYLMKVIQQLELQITSGISGAGGGGGGTIVQVISPYLVDSITGIPYQLLMVNGVISQQQITAVPAGIPQTYFVVQDSLNGHTYRVVSTNGTIGLQQIT